MTNEYPADLVPILEAIADRAARLCESPDARIFVVDGDALRYVAGFGEVPFPTDPIRPLSRGLTSGRAVIDRDVVHVEDMAAAEKEFPEGHRYQRRLGYRSTALAVPLVRGDKALGVILLRRSEVRPFDTKHIELVKAFADQAAVAIENLRLSTELKARNAELTEALEQQTATAEILRVISNSPADIQPVLDAVAESAARLCGGSDVIIRRVDGDVLRVAAHFGPVPVVSDALPVTRKSFGGRAFLERRTIHIHDTADEHVQADFSASPSVRQGNPYRTILVAPLLREATAIGVINMRRPEVRPFSDKQVKLFETFAAQAAIAIENVRLFNETKEALEQQTATAEILKVISSSPTDVQPVFDAIVNSCTHLFGSMNSTLRLVQGDRSQLVASTSPYREAAGLLSVPLDDDRLPAARAVLRREVVQVSDAVAEEWVSPQFRERAAQRGFRSIMVAPMLRENNVIGTINVSRAAPGPFTEKQVALLKTFSAQAVIAIENVRLFNETKEALEQQTAISEILRVISSSPTDVQPVLDAVAARAARICDAADANIFLVEGGNARHTARFGDMQLGIVKGETRPLERAWGTGRAILDRIVVHVEDMAAASEYPNIREIQRHICARTILAVPLMREDRALGAIVLRRTEVRPFSDKQVALLRTFADQAAIAIENVRLFKETKEALEQQTATANILKIISSSPTDTQPVFDAIVKSGLHLFGGLDVTLRLVKGDQTEQAA
ncbi:MAG: GAF domain-containing protein, partial [Burkholderiales bacterium]